MTKTIDKNKLITIRSIRAEDRNFILATWLRGLFYGDTWFSLIPKSIFMDNYHKILETALARPNTKVSVACLRDDVDTIVGYSVSHNNLGVDIVDWVFVKSAWRGIKLIHDLIPKNAVAYTHSTKAGAAIAAKHYPDLMYNPFVF
jgi:hypothetical protein